MFKTSILVRFGDLDAAGIAFYPRLVNFLNEALEDFFAAHVGRSFPEVHRDGLGLPVVKLEVEFRAPVRYGDSVELKVAVEHVGRSSFRMRYDASVEGRPVFRARSTLVAVDRKAFRPVPIPDWMRGRLEAARG
jgi:4-hydroxybenzoyl-CoA thioesterase